MGSGMADVRRRIPADVRRSIEADAVNGGADHGASALPRQGAVYVDEAIWEWRGLKWAHLLADDIDDLHRFAAALGIHRMSLSGAAPDLGPPLRSDLVRTAPGHRPWRDRLRPR